jgi:hypothetical protein
MKIDIQDIIGGITAVRQKIGAGLVDWSPDSTWNPFDPNGFRERLDKYGEIDGVDFNQIHISEDGTLEIGGRKVLVYIRDIRVYKSYERKLPKFHIADCITLQNARAVGRYEKYVASNKTDGKFEIRELDSLGKTKNSVGELNVCKNCLERLNYKNYAINYRQRNDIYVKFSIKEFFEQYKATDIVQPKRNADTDPTNNYSKDWDTISRQRKRVKSYICENCHVNLATKLNLLQVHHKNRRKDDNRPENLVVLCVDCHSKQGGDHAQIKNTLEYREFMKTYRQRNFNNI